MTTLSTLLNRGATILRPRLALPGPASTAPTPEPDARLVRHLPGDLRRPGPLLMRDTVFDSIREHIGSARSETGGAMGGARGSGLVTTFDFDATARTTRSRYYPDVTRLNDVFASSWNPQGINLLGFCHSHPAGATQPSDGDRRYAADILAAIPELPRLLLPIVQTVPDTGRFGIRAYAAERAVGGPRIVPLPLEVVADTGELAAPPELARVTSAYQDTVMATSRFVAVGCGGSAAFLDDLARTGIGEIVLIDPDVVEPPNASTQQAYLDEVGRPKVEALGARLVRANSRLRVHTVHASLDDLDDAAMRRLCLEPLPGGMTAPPQAVVLGAFTDDFHAQARVARLGLHLKVATIAGLVYAEGHGVEVTFAAAGVTPACQRCVLSRRYAAYLDQGFRNDIGSAGSPIGATMRLNALKMPIVLGLLHSVSPRADPGHPGTSRHRAVLDAVAERNLVLTGLTPQAADHLSLSLFAEVPSLDARGRLPFDSTIWLEQRPDRPEHGFPTCPDCGGTGELGDAEGRFSDTRPMPREFGDQRW
jgi:proteasome lid subunit RPN8/RPN11